MKDLHEEAYSEIYSQLCESLGVEVLTVEQEKEVEVRAMVAVSDVSERQVDFAEYQMEDR